MARTGKPTRGQHRAILAIPGELEPDQDTAAGEDYLRGYITAGAAPWW